MGSDQSHSLTYNSARSASTPPCCVEDLKQKLATSAETEKPEKSQDSPPPGQEPEPKDVVEEPKDAKDTSPPEPADGQSGEAKDPSKTDQPLGTVLAPLDTSSAVRQLEEPKDPEKAEKTPSTSTPSTGKVVDGKDRMDEPEARSQRFRNALPCMP